MPIRWRLTVWFALVLTVILMLSGTVHYLLLRNYLINEVDDTLSVTSARVHGTLNPAEMPAPLDYDVIHAKLPLINEFAFPGIYIQLIDHNGKVVVKSDNLGEQELPVDTALVETGFAGKVEIKTIPAGDDVRIRMMVSPLYLKDGALLLEVAQSLKHVDATTAQVRYALLASILLAFALAVVSGVLLVRRALSPVERITRTAKSIEAGSDLGRRVGYDGPRDEIARLAETFDHMLEHLDRVFKSQRDFVADASHELRSPLTVIQGNLDLLKRNISEEDRRESLRAIDAETARMTKIISNLLLLAEVESGQPESKELVSLKEILAGEYNRALFLGGNRKIAIGRQEDLEVRGDSYRLKQVLSNLMDNAIRYTPEGGTITLSLFRDNDWARLEVADTGVGISREHLPHIFDRFYRVDKARSRARGGTGLGLAIVKGIVEQHGGKVTVDSEPGKGSTFTVWLKL